MPLTTVLREWGRIGLIGFGGPPAHIALLRRRIVEERGWIAPDEFEAAIAACNLLPGPASTQLAIFCAYRVAGRRGALVGGLAFIVPAVVCVILLSLLFLASAPPLWIRGAGDGAGAAVAAVAVSAGWALLKPSWHKARGISGARVGRWALYGLIGGASAVLVGPYLVIALLACGLFELAWTVGIKPRDHLQSAGGPPLTALVLAATGGVGAVGGIGALVWVAFKVGALSFGGGFVIIPLMQHDAVHDLPLDVVCPVSERCGAGPSHTRPRRGHRRCRRLCSARCRGSGAGSSRRLHAVVRRGDDRWAAL